MDTTWTIGIYCPTESKSILLLVEGSGVVASHSHFCSPVNQSHVLLCLWQPQLWFSWSMCVFYSTHPHSTSSPPLYPTICSEGPSSQSWLAAHVLVHLAWFFFEPHIGCQNLSPFPALLCFWLMLLFTCPAFYFLLYQLKCRFLLEIKTKTLEIL